ncbi:LexA family protein [Legionella gresilensis]|uniref:LexA family protein n=1 Tax=Legionella gresilensis TaxID=91823 RepID=UPI0010419711|nr:S24 family peptidase [Legionella gresilensis]
MCYAICPDDVLDYLGIYKDDLLIIHKKEAHDGDLVLSLEENELILRVLKETETNSKLVSHHDDYESISLDSNPAVTIVGVVAYVMLPISLIVYFS